MLKGLVSPSFQGGCLNLLSWPLLALSRRVHGDLLCLQKEVEAGSFSDLQVRPRQLFWPCLAAPQHPGQGMCVWASPVNSLVGTAERVLMRLTLQLGDQML